MKNIKCLSAVVAAVMLVCAAPVFADATSMSINEQAAALKPGEWLVAPMTGSASDIVNIGTLAEFKDTWGTGKMTYANCVCTGDESVNGVPLGEGYGSNHEDRGINGLPGDKKTEYGTCGLDATSEYANILSSGRELWTATGVQTFTLSGLKTGKNYLVQVVIHNEKRPGSTATAGGQTMHYGSADSSGEWYYGGTLIHVFMATSDTYSFDIDFEADAGSTAIKQINAVQVRLMPELTIEERAADLAAAFIAGTSSEQWLGLPMTGSPDDIVTTGTVVIAQAFSKGGVTTDATVKSIAFSSSQDGVATDTAVATSDDGFGYADCDTSTAYGKMLDQAWKSGSTGHTVAYTLSGLESGHTYIMQMVIHHGSRTGNEVSAGGKKIRYSSNSSGDWFYGGSFIHVFTATATTYTFNVAYTQQDMYNMLQVRDVTPVRTIAEQAEALQPGEWLAAPLTGDPSDVLTLGEPITYTAFNETYTNAYAAGAGSAVLSIGGVDFVNGNYKNVSGGGGVYGGHQQGNCGVAAPYGSMLDELYFKDDTTLTLTIGPDNGYPALEPGETYLVQLFIHSALWDDTATVANTDKTVRFCAQNAGDEWYYGGTFVHKFTATRSSYSFTINYSNSRAIYNAVLVRKLPKSLEPVAPSFTLGAPTVDGTSATITLTDVVKGTDTTGATDATTYRVFAYEGDDPTAADEVASDQSGTTANFQVSDLAAGTHAYHVYIVNDQGATSVTNTVSFKIVKSVNEWVADMSVGDWRAVPMTGSPSDIATIGESPMVGTAPNQYPMAYSKGGGTGDATVNGLKFTDSKSNLTINPNIASNGSNDNSCGTTGDYANIMTKFWTGSASDSDGTVFTYSNLDPSKTYLVQIILHNGRDDNFGKGYQYAATAGGKTIYLSSETSEGEWYYGGSLLHVFQPNQDGTYSFNVLYTKTTDGSIIGGQLNAIQLRDVTPVPTIVEQAEALTAADGWLALPMQGAPTDFATNGTCIAATGASNGFSSGGEFAHGGDASVAGIPFRGSKAYYTSGAGEISWPDNGWYEASSSGGWCCLAGTDPTTDYGKIMSGTRIVNDPATVTLNQLIEGRDYLIQIFIHNGRYDGMTSGTDGTTENSNQDFYLSTATIGGKTITYGAKTSDGEWYYGGTLLKKFTADSTGTYSFTVDYSGTPQFNAMQLRLLPEVIEPTPVYTLTIPAHDHLSVASVTTNSVPVEGVAGAYSIVSNTEVSITFTAESGWEITSGNPVVLTIEADTELADGQFPAVRQAAVTPGWTAVPMDANGQSFSTDGTLVFSFSRDRGDPHMTYLNTSCSVPFNYINLLTDTVTQWHSSQHGGAAINGPYDDGRQPSDFITTTPVFNGADDKCGDEGQGGNMATFGSMLQVAWEGQNLSTYDNQATYTLHNLEPGYQYLVEFFIHCSGENKTITAPDGVATVYYGDPNTSDDDTTWRYGGILRGIFNANSGTQDIVLTYSDSGSFRMNAIQLRKLGPVPPPENPYTVTGDPETIIDGDYIVYVWTNAAQTGTLTIPSNVSADYLLVGGGGAGGFCRGGGGGGGGVVYRTAQTLSSGTYTIAVGAGGTPDSWTPTGSNDPYKNSGSSTAGTDGGTSALTIATVPVCEAFGGGGGGTFITGQNSEFAVYGNSGAGRTGANAGGSANKAGSTAASVASGFAGGAAWSGGDAASGGGGGASANGVAASSNSVSGNGGAGVSCSITGEPVTYGGGGGAGVYSGTAGVGGLGGGGNGGKGDSNSNAGMTAGVDGLGGGGGGAAGGGNRWDCCGGAPGGSGTVIVRLPLDPSSQAIRPAFVLATPAVSGTSATITLNNVVIGTDESGATQATSYDVFAYTGDDPAVAVEVASDEDGTTANFMLTNLTYGDLTYRVFIVNNQNFTSETASVSFTIVDTRPLEERVPDMRGGDWLGMPLTGEPADVLTNGTLITVKDNNGREYQFSYGRTGSGSVYMTDATVNNVPAIDSTVGFGVRDSGSLNWTGFQGEGAGDCGTTGQYALYMSKFFKCSRSNTDVTISCTVPAAGTYLVQMFVHYQSDSYLNQYVSVVGNSDVKIPYTAASGAPGYYGGTLVHVFEMAAAGTYEFSLHYDKEVICNYIQVRDVSAMIPQEPRLPSITAANVLVEGDCAQVTITGVDMGTDEDGYLATSYDVYASVDGATATLVAEDRSEATAMFLLSGLSQGEHDVDVYIVNDKERTSEALPVEVTIVSAPTGFFPNGNWEALPLSKEATEIRTFGEGIYALACSAGNNGRLYTVNGLKYHDTQRNNVSWGDWQLVNWADFEPALNSDKDGFGGEDVPTISGEDMAFQTVCKRAWLSENGSRMTTDFTMTLKQLEPGARYVVQLTAHNGSDNYGGKGQTMTAPDGVSTITLGDADATGACRYGGTLIGTFVASNTTHSFHFTYGPDARYYQVNSLQLRKLGAAPAVVPAYPTLGGTSVFVGRGSATLTVSGLNAGVTDGACDIYYALAEEGQAFGAYMLGAQNVSDASCTFVLSNIESGKTYVYSVYAVNPATKLASLKTNGRFAVSSNPGIPEEMTVEPLIRPGLVQAKFGGGVLFGSQIQPPLVSNLLSQTDYDGQLDYTYGALMANQNCADENVKVVNTYTATQWNWDKTNTVFAYEGEIYLQKGRRLVIFGRFDDGEAAVVDGVTLLAQGSSSGYNSEPATRWVVYEPAESGWYPLNAWVWDWSSGKNCMTPPSALSYNLAGITTYNDQNRDQWKHLEDTDGMGSFLRFKDPTKTLMTLGVPTTNGVDVTINAAFTQVPGAAKFVAYVSTSHDGDLDPLAWDEVVKIADIQSGDTAAADYTVKGLAAYPFVRFAIEGEGSISTAERCRNFRQMSCVVGFNSEELSILVASPVFTKNSGNFNVVVASMGDATALDLDVEVSSDSAFGTTVYQGKIEGIVNPGSFPVELTDLDPATTYYIRVKPTTAGDDAWIVSAPVETAEAGVVRINEIMASNGDTFKTKNGRSGLDWIEIYNGTDEIVDLSGWYLYDDPAKAQSKWKKIQGKCVIPVHGYGIVWCDKDYTDWDAANEAWSEIGLSTSGETVFLATPEGTVVDTVTFGTQMKEISYGVGKLLGSDEETHVFFKVSTPGAENGEYGYGPMTPTVAFSVPHGYKTEPVDVAITCEADPDADIYYTLDGSQPTTASTKYTEPIHITSTTILRAGVPQENTVLQIDSSATYIYLNDVLSMDRVETGADVPAGFPESSAKHTMRYGMIQGVVNGEDRERILRGFTNTVATLSIVMDPVLLFGTEDGIYVNSRKYMLDGAAGERPMLLEQIDPVNGAANEFSVPGGLRLRGSSSLAGSNPKHSFRFFFRGKYGMAKLNFPLFGDEGADEFSKVDLRCSQNYSWSMNNSDYDTFIHELFSRDSQRDLGQPYTRTRYYNLFINGQYWGLYMTQERGDKDFGETYLGGNEDYYDCIKTSSQDQYHYVTTANDGTIDAWRNLQGLAYNGFAGDYVDNYNRALGLNPDGTRNEAYPILLNPENLMAYVTIVHFVCDADGPVSVGNGGLNNLYANRYQIDGGSSMDGFWFLRHDAEHSLGVKGEGAEFATWTQYDVDNTGLGTHEYNPLDSAWSNGYRGDPPEKDNGSVGAFGPYELHAQLAKNPVYKRAFADYFYKHYLKEGGAMTPAVAKQRFEARMAEIDDVIVSEAARWSPNASQPKSREIWLNACSNCLDFIDHRTAYMKQQYINRGWYPTLEPPTADVADGEGAIGQVVNFTAADGAEIYVTTDGSDPAESGTLSASATVPALPCTIKARAKLNDEWSPAQEVTLVAPKLTGDGLIITIAGNYTSTQELAPTGDVCRVILYDANVPGGLILKPGVAYTFEPAAETENAIGRIVGGDTSTFVLNGEGTLSMTGSDTLLTVNDLIVSNGTFAIKSTGVSAKKTPIVKVMGNLFQTGGVIDIDVSVDSSVQVYGIMLASKKMEAEFSGGELVAKVGGQLKSAAIVTDKGSSDIVFKKECKITAELSGVDSRLAFSAGEIKFAKTLVGPVVVTMPQDLTGVSEAHVFKAEKTIEINGGTFDINVPATGSEIFSASRPDEAADEDPGIIVIKGGTFELVADDDCFNATDFIDVRDGLFYAVSLSDDVFDSNGGMDISGGTILAYATGAGHEAFDVEPEATQMAYPSTNEHVLAISGGTIFATGGEDSAWPKEVTTAEGVNLYSLEDADVSAYSGKYLTLNSSPKVTAKLPVFPASTGSVLATCPGFDGANVSVGDTAPTSGSQNFHDLYIHGPSGFIIIVQ